MKTATYQLTNILLISIIYLSFNAGCGKSIKYVFKSKSVINSGLEQSLIRNLDTTINVTHVTQSRSYNISISYLGCGGIMINVDNESIIFDPFFSNQSFLRVPFGRISTTPPDVVFGLRDLPDLQSVKAVFISHSHYDHLMDTPYIISNFLNSDVELFGSGSVLKITGSVIPNTIKHNLEDKNGNWINVGNRFRILPIKSDHAPHIVKPILCKLYAGEADTILSYTSPFDKTKAAKWKEGITFSFIIDVMDGKVPLRRFFLQSSAADPPAGTPSSEILSSKRVDLAILGASLYSNTPKGQYPWAILDTMKPKHLMICHWEDFFRPYQEYPKRFARKTNFTKFLPELNTFLKESDSTPNSFFLLEPGTRINLE